MKKLQLLFLGLVCSATFVCVNVQAAVNVSNPGVYEKIVENLQINITDLNRYRKIFDYIKQADFKKADEVIGRLDSQVLKGYVLAEKYLHSAYRTSPKELEEWLENYNDHPQAKRIYNLALKKNVENPQKPATYVAEQETQSGKISLKYLERLAPQDRNFLVRQAKNFKRHIRRGKTLSARKILENEKFKKLAPAIYWDSLAAKLALKYLVDNYDAKALEWGQIASKRRNSGTATWVAGLASWRQKNFMSAASYFARLGSSNNSDKWLVAAGAYWSARAYEKLGNHMKAQEMLKLAKKHKHTFYGILAAYKLNEKINFNFVENTYIENVNADEYVDEILSSPALTRFLVLLMLKKNSLAEDEMLYSYAGLTDNQKEAVVILSGKYGLHSLVISLSKNVATEMLQERFVREIYPLPQRFSDKKWQVNKALVLALVRQESAFRYDAKSKAGARGLMQLMPNTAYHISGDKSVKIHKNKLLDVDYNLDLGQKYVEYLLSKPFVEGNLFFMLTAYNAGPSNLLKWQKNSRYYNDPLLFIEVLPSAETRIYIERVMANYWIYNMRFGYENNSLEQLFKNEWPILAD